MTSKPPFQTEILGAAVEWQHTEEEEGVDRWVVEIRFPKTKLDVNVCNPAGEPPGKFLRPVSKLVSKLHAEFPNNINSIADWYARTDGKYDDRTFRQQLLSSVTLFVDYDARPIERQLNFWDAADFQHLSPRVTLNGKVKI